MSRRTHVAAAIAVALGVAACAPAPAPEVDAGTGAGYRGRRRSATAITFDATGDWTWMPFADTRCGDGTSTGLGVRKGSSSRDLVVFLDGGGACWSWRTCMDAVSTAFDRSFGEGSSRRSGTGSSRDRILDPQALPSTWRNANLVFVPYCTGDVHSGDREKTYSWAGELPITWEHRGHANVMAFLKRLKATFPAVDRLLVAGSSAGGFSTVTNYEAFRWYWPQAKGYLLDDSGPTLVGDDIDADLRTTWYEAWNLGASLGQFCVECRTDMSAGFAAIARKHPGDRIALVSHVEDPVMTAFFTPLDNPCSTSPPPSAGSRRPASEQQHAGVLRVGRGRAVRSHAPHAARRVGRLRHVRGEPQHRRHVARRLARGDARGRHRLGDGEALRAPRKRHPSRGDGVCSSSPGRRSTGSSTG